MDSIPFVNSAILLLLGILIGGYMSRKQDVTPKGPPLIKTVRSTLPVKHDNESQMPTGESNAEEGIRKVESIQKGPKPMCIRISGIPKDWSKADLLTVLRTFDPSLAPVEKQYSISVYPSCYGRDNTALLNVEIGANIAERLKMGGGIDIPSCDLILDSHFYGLTPLNTPQGGILAE
jgi:hypothetical protein